MDGLVRTTAMVLLAMSECWTGCSGTKPRGASACGVSACEQRTWPRLIVTLSSDLTDVDIKASYADGVVREGIMDGCPSGYASTLDCTFAFYGDAMTSAMKISVFTAGKLVGSRDVTLTPFNYCGNGVAHVIVELSDAGAPVIRDPEYINACGII